MAKFKVGDKVRILPRKNGQAQQYPEYVDEMTKLAGTTCTVEHVSGRYIELAGNDWGWHEDWLVLVPVGIKSKEDMEALYG
jgi:hypothetical protein